MKKYIDAQLQVVRMSNSDIVTASAVFGEATDTQLDAGRRMDDWDAGY